MQYQVPQFIEVEDKIFGPFTARQFVYLAGTGGVALASISILPLFFAMLIAIPVGALGIALAFYTVNGRPFINVLEHAFNYSIKSKLYLWSAQRRKETEKKSAPTAPQEALVPKLSESKLHDLSWSLNIKDRALMGVKDAPDRQFSEGVDLESIRL